MMKIDIWILGYCKEEMVIVIMRLELIIMLRYEDESLFIIVFIWLCDFC